MELEKREEIIELYSLMYDNNMRVIGDYIVINPVVNVVEVIRIADNKSIISCELKTGLHTRKNWLILDSIKYEDETEKLDKVIVILNCVTSEKIIIDDDKLITELSNFGLYDIVCINNTLIIADTKTLICKVKDEHAILVDYVDGLRGIKAESMEISKINEEGIIEVKVYSKEAGNVYNNANKSMLLSRFLLNSNTSKVIYYDVVKKDGLVSVAIDNACNNDNRINRRYYTLTDKGVNTSLGYSNVANSIAVKCGTFYKVIGANLRSEDTNNTILNNCRSQIIDKDGNIVKIKYDRNINVFGVTIESLVDNLVYMEYESVINGHKIAVADFDKREVILDDLVQCSVLNSDLGIVYCIQSKNNRSKEYYIYNGKVCEDATDFYREYKVYTSNLHIGEYYVKVNNGYILINSQFKTVYTCKEISDDWKEVIC